MPFSSLFSNSPVNKSPITIQQTPYEDIEWSGQKGEKSQQEQMPCFLLQSMVSNEGCQGNKLASAVMNALTRFRAVFVWMIDIPHIFNFLAEKYPNLAKEELANNFLLYLSSNWLRADALKLGDEYWAANESYMVGVLEKLSGQSKIWLQGNTANERIAYFNNLAKFYHINLVVMRWDEIVKPVAKEFAEVFNNRLFDTNEKLKTSLQMSVISHASKKCDNNNFAENLILSEGYFACESTGIYLALKYWIPFYQKIYLVKPSYGSFLAYPGRIPKVFEETRDFFCSEIKDLIIWLQINFHKPSDKKSPTKNTEHSPCLSTLVQPGKNKGKNTHKALHKWVIFLSKIMPPEQYGRFMYQCSALNEGESQPISIETNQALLQEAERYYNLCITETTQAQQVNETEVFKQARLLKQEFFLKQALSLYIHAVPLLKTYLEAKVHEAASPKGLVQTVKNIVRTRSHDFDETACADFNEIISEQQTPESPQKVAGGGMPVRCKSGEITREQLKNKFAMLSEKLGSNPNSGLITTAETVKHELQSSSPRSSFKIC